MSIGPQLAKALSEQAKWLAANPAAAPQEAPGKKSGGCCSAEDTVGSKEGDAGSSSDNDQARGKSKGGLTSSPAFGGVIPENTLCERPYKPGKNHYLCPWENTLDQSGPANVLKWKLTGSPPKFPGPAEAAEKCPSVPVDHGMLTRHENEKETVQATWMGHASFLVQANGINVLTDPVWSSRCAPTQFVGPKRYVAPPIELTEFPVPIHVVSISHNHYDHLDTETVRKLRELYNPYWVVPKGMKKDWFNTTFKKYPQDLDKVFELDWWECVSLDVEVSPAAATTTDNATTTSASIHITAVPVQHWSMRTGPWDRNAQLWCGFVFEVPTTIPSEDTTSGVVKEDVKRYFHCGDTGYVDQCFKTIGSVFQHSFDLALIPIGAYHPRWFLAPQHVDPAEAVMIHNDLGRPQLSLGMHWGTWILTDEPIDEPKKLLVEEAAKAGLRGDEFIALKHGETVKTPTGKPLVYSKSSRAPA